MGPLFGAVLARALDAWWAELGRPDGFTVVEVGAGRGTLAGAILAAADRPGLRYVAVERSAALRALHPPGVESSAVLPDGPLVGVIVANELLDNLPFALLERTAGGWAEVRVDENVSEVLVARSAGPAVDAPVGARIPIQRQAAAWVADARARLRTGRVVALDYCDETGSMARRPWSDWVRTYRGHGRGGHPLTSLGEQDVTCEVAVDQLPPPTGNHSQADFLRAYGLDELVDDARRAWTERAAVGDLQALTARSRVHEGAALVDPAGLGAFRVLEWAVQGR